MISAPELVLDARADLGEGPAWEPNTGSLYWVDIHAGRLHMGIANGAADEFESAPLQLLGDDGNLEVARALPVAGGSVAHPHRDRNGRRAAMDALQERLPLAVAPDPMQLHQLDPLRLGIGPGHGREVLQRAGVLAVRANVGEQEQAEVDLASCRQDQSSHALDAATEGEGANHGQQRERNRRARNVPKEAIRDDP